MLQSFANSVEVTLDSYKVDIKKNGSAVISLRQGDDDYQNVKAHTEKK